MLIYDPPDLAIIPEDEDAFNLRTINSELEYSFLLNCFSLGFIILIKRINWKKKKY
ncbi:MAG TPA: hypothetical protein VMX55_02765 [candidate division Zixibacteria bacterium]|nr:hypothetical protein [candidate division Zixibacteria bacterium]